MPTATRIRTRTRKATAAKKAPAKKPAASVIKSSAGVKIAETHRIDAPPPKPPAKATAPKAAAAKVTYAANPREWLQAAVDATGIDGLRVDMVDETAGVLVYTFGGLTCSFVPHGAKIDVEFTSPDEKASLPEAASLPGVTPRSSPENVAKAIIAFSPGMPPKQRRTKRTAPSQSGGRTVTITQADYDRQIAAIDKSDLGSRYKAAAKAVLTKKAREGGLNVAGSRKPTETMTIEQIRARRSEAAKRAVATRRENEARAVAAAKKAIAPRKRKTA